MSNTRIPMQKRSVEKRNRIIEKGFELMCEKGFYNTNTVEIAEYACVSTGIIYQYFNDKKDIFIEGVKNYSNSIMKSMLDIIDKKIEANDIANNFPTDVKEYIASNCTSDIRKLEGAITRIFSCKSSYKTKKIAWIHNDISKVFGKSINRNLKN